VTGPVAISGTVPITGSVGITGGTVDVSGPVSISGGVDVSNSTINVGAVDTNTTILGTFTGTVPANTTLNLYDSGAAGTALKNFQSLLIIATNPNGGTCSPVDFVTANINWLTAAGDYLTVQRPIFHSGGQMIYQIPIQSSRVIIGLTTSSQPSASPYGPQKFIIAATPTLLPRRYYQTPAPLGQNPGLTLAEITDNSTAGFYGADVTAQAGGGTLYIPNNSGKTSLWFDAPNATPNVTTLVAIGRGFTPATSGRIFYSSTSATTIINNTPLVLPEAPIIATVSSGARSIFSLATEL
jgi:hypothetical protein